MSPASPFDPDLPRILQWNARGLCARSDELLQFGLLFPVDVFCIQEPKLNSASSYRIPGYSILCLACMHFQASLSPDDVHAGSGKVVFIK